LRIQRPVSFQQVVSHALRCIAERMACRLYKEI